MLFYLLMTCNKLCLINYVLFGILYYLYYAIVNKYKRSWA